jgi:hypothetical protein
MYEHAIHKQASHIQASNIPGTSKQVGIFTYLNKGAVIFDQSTHGKVKVTDHFNVND